LLDEQPLFVRLGRHGHEQPLPLSAVGVHRLVRRSCLAAGVPERLSHPHALRAYWATHCLEAGVPVHTVSARLGHVDLRTTARYAAPRPEQIDEIADVLDRRHRAARRAGGVGVAGQEMSALQFRGDDGGYGARAGRPPREVQ
jgi:integrase